MAYIERSLAQGEEIRELYKLHWITKIPMWMCFITAIPTLGLFLIVAVFEWLRLANIEQGATNKRV